MPEKTISYEKYRAEQQKLQKLVESGLALSREFNHEALMTLILKSAKELTNSDGGTLYTRHGDELRFEIVMNDSLHIMMGGTSGKDIPFPPLALKDPETGKPNHKSVAGHAALEAKTVRIDDAYLSEEFDFTGAKKFDAAMNYRSKSFIAIPLMPRQGKVTGVIQLINAMDPHTGEVTTYDPELVGFVEALSAQAAVALDNQSLINAQRALLDSMIKLLASAIDAKSPYTGGHCERVPDITLRLAEVASESNEPPFNDFKLTTDDEWRELRIAAWLHDCGKVTTPEFVVDKATKLETIYNRIHEIRTRFEVLHRDAEIEYWKARATGERPVEELDKELKDKQEALQREFTFVANANEGGEFMTDEDKMQLHVIGEKSWMRHFDDRIGLSQDELRRINNTPAPELPVEEKLLADKSEHIIPHTKSPEKEYAQLGLKIPIPKHLYNRGEIYNLSISRGTLTPEDRFKINEHVIQSIKMLEELPFPEGQQRVPEYAGAHHETMIGTGYPRKLTADDISIPARIMAIADVFEALTASDRPYKKAKPLSQAIKILSFMKKDQHIDGDLFDLFLRSGVYRDYAEAYLSPEQIDDVDIEAYLS